MRSLFVMAVALVCLAAVPSAQAAPPKTHAPPGNSGVDEYLEVVPGGGGNTPPRRTGRRPGTGVLNRAQLRALNKQGTTGLEAAGVAERTGGGVGNAPSRRSRRSNRGQGQSQDGAAQLAALRTANRKSASSEDNGAFAAVKRIATELGPAGLGASLSVLLLAILAVLAGVRLVRRRRSTDA